MRLGTTMTCCARAFGPLSLTLLFLAFSGSAAASPTMVRLGYARCSTCHLSPQGAGLLTDYGKGIDQAQSLKGGEYQAADDTRPDWLRDDGRLLVSMYALTAADSGLKAAAPTWLRGFF